MRRTFPRAALALLAIPAALLLFGMKLGSGAERAAGPLPAPTVGSALTSGAALDTAVFAGGCFWGVEAVFEHLVGVEDVVSGFAGGSAESPSYEQVSTGDTGHAESVRVVYDPAKISYGQLLQVFFSVAHDPTQLNRQGPDVGTQYRSAIFYRGEAQKKAAEAYIAQLKAARSYARPIVTEVAALHAFYPAEAYHQNYLVRHPNQPYIVINDMPKLSNLRKQFPQLYRERAAE